MSKQKKINMKNMWIVSLFLFSTPLFSKDPIGKVTRSRGDVLSLQSGKLKRGDPVFEGMETETGTRSFVKILFNDQTKVSVGLKSKTTIKRKPKKGVGVITLLKGKIRSEVPTDPLTQESNEKKKVKFLFRTKTAAIGVRGTDDLIL